jgi:hypothetical protein
MSPSPAAPASPTAPTAAITTRIAAAGAAAGSAAAAPDTVWVPLASGVLVLAAGAMSLATGKPWLFAALGPTAVMIAHAPGHVTTRFQSVVLGHAAGAACGYLALLLCGVSGAASLGQLGGPSTARVWASAFAVVLTALVQPPLRAWHPPAAATSLLITLGATRLSSRTALALLGGVLVVAILGEWLQRVRLRATRAGSGRG